MSGRKPNILQKDKGSEFYNGTMKSQLQDNDVEMYSTQDEGKSAIAERFIRALNIKSTNT